MPRAVGSVFQVGVERPQDAWPYRARFQRNKSSGDQGFGAAAGAGGAVLAAGALAAGAAAGLGAAAAGAA
ncbi:hypothetical protein, partial [uncultured Thiodictyon sp.]|uniref:hypothetical protein n=1 Tax=uncultured Thiodictyon sp. TaxID=1846217 RepID=UPI0025F940E8